MLEKLHHHGGDLMHKGRVDVSGDECRVNAIDYSPVTEVGEQFRRLN
ncbi:hypothetical protein [Rhizobium leguminosarum]|nr:hypothetical protein [Rhizobium leguminosarum]MBY5405771.1 hypothetical protein [Rhizobium leguminosarum]